MLDMVKEKYRGRLMESAPLIGGIFAFAAACGTMLALAVVLGISFT